MAGSWINSLKVWSYKNTLLPACMSLALLTGLGLHMTRNIRLGIGKPIRYFHPFVTVVIILLFIQFFMLFYNPVELVPTHRERQAAQAILERLRDLPGETLVFNHGFVNFLAGKTTYLQSSPLGDILIGKPAPGSDAYWRRETANLLLEQALSEQRFDWVVIDSANTSWPPYYIYATKYIEDNGAKYPGRGDSMVPKSLMVRNPIARGGIFPLDDPMLENLFLEGWGKRETWGRWAISDSSILAVILVKGPSYTINIVARPFCIQNLPSIQSMQILWNGKTIGNGTFTTCEEHSLEFSLQKDMVKKEANELHFIFEQTLPQSKSNSDGESLDPPSVGLSLIQFSPK